MISKGEKQALSKGEKKSLRISEKKSLSIEKKLRKKVDDRIRCSVARDSIHLNGYANSWDDVVRAGYIAAHSSFREVINDIFFEQKCQKIQLKVNESTRVESDVVIVGAGIVGCAIARELSKYNLNISLLEKEYDVGIHASSRNDGMVHPGIASKSGSLKVKMNIRGVELYKTISQELGVPIRWCGSTILFESHLSKCLKPFFRYKARKIGMSGLKFLNHKQVYEREPHLKSGVKWAVLCEDSGVTSPYKMTIAYAENAVVNGVDLYLNTEVAQIEVLNEPMLVSELKKTESGNYRFAVHTTQGTFLTRMIINAAGVHADEIAELVDDRFYTIHPRKGDVVLFDKKKSALVYGILGYMKDRSSKNTKGGGIIKTYEGNILVGPNAIEIPERENYETTRESLEALLNQKLHQIPALKRDDDITYFTGIRAATYKEDFIIEASKKVVNFIHVAGIQSPGFASAPAIAERVENLVKQGLFDHDDLTLTFKQPWLRNRTPIPNLAEMTSLERSKWIEKRPDYGDLICRCEEISRGEIIDALSGPIPVATIDGIKRRVRAGMGRCQGGFCMPLVMEIIHEVNQIPMTEITQKSGASVIVKQLTK